MNILGIKLTHDGAVALIDDGKLIFSYEMEKMNNNDRFSHFMLGTQEIGEILKDYNYSFDQIDAIAIDGWSKETMLAEEPFDFIVDLGKGKYSIELEGYGHLIKNEDILKGKTFYAKGQIGFDYRSYYHVSSHVLGAYCASPFSKRKQDSFVLSWDGGMVPQMFYFKNQLNKVENCGYLFPLVGFMYHMFAVKYKPYEKYLRNLSLSGKFMAYIALGRVIRDLLNHFFKIYRDLKKVIEKSPEFSPIITEVFTTNVIKHFVEYGKSQGYEDVNVMATFNAFLQDLLLSSLEKFITNYPGYQNNLCFCGGSALNIKWNSAIRNSGIFKKIWVPPFPNDSGCALGAACCEMVNKTGINSLDWDVYKGPPLMNKDVSFSWAKRKCSLKELAKILHETSEPVVFLNGRAELGPRALGNRSIIAPAVSKKMKDKLNDIKKREDYRPVAPICIEEDAAEIFDPGIPDPYMLFDHIMRANWKDKVPAVLHIDGTSRLQTVNRNENQKIYDLLREYKKLSGIPLLCNTSANYKGKGFFPDVQSALDWGKTNLVWNDNILYLNPHFKDIKI